MNLLQVLEGAAYVAFIAGAIFAVMELRSISRDRKIDVVLRMGERWNSHDFTEALVNVAQADFQSAETAEKTCSKTDLVMVAEFFDWVGSLVRKKLVSEEFVTHLFDFETPWKLMKPWCLEWRRRSTPNELGCFEWMAERQHAVQQEPEQMTSGV